MRKMANWKYVKLLQDVVGVMVFMKNLNSSTPHIDARITEPTQITTKTTAAMPDPSKHHESKR